MHSVSFGKGFNNSKLFFSKSELTKILSCYSLGVSSGKWNDYAIECNNNEANFFIFKHTLATPDCVLTKSFKSKKKIVFKLNIANEVKNKFNQIDDLLILLKRKNLKII